MALTKSFDEALKGRLQKSATFRRASLKVAVGTMIAGDLETGKSVLRKYNDGTVGFVHLGADQGRSLKVLTRMFSPTGNRLERNLFEIVAFLQKIEGTVQEAVDRAAA